MTSFGVQDQAYSVAASPLEELLNCQLLLLSSAGFYENLSILADNAIVLWPEVVRECHLIFPFILFQ